MAFLNPAPGEYCPERADALNHTPRYSFGVKTQPPKPMNTPGKLFIHCAVCSVQCALTLLDPQTKND